MANINSKTQLAPKSRKRIVVGIPSASAAAKNNSDSKLSIHESNQSSSPETADLNAKSDNYASISISLKGVSDGSMTKKKSQKRKSAQVKAPSKPKKAKTVKDPNQPKRPPTAFMLFMDDFRKVYKQAYPNSNGVIAVAKQGGEKWKSISAEDKAAYVNKSLIMKEEYQKALQAYKSGIIPQTSCESVVTDDIVTHDKFDEPDTLSSVNGVTNEE